MSIIIASIISLGCIGAFFGAILGFASRVFYVEVDPKIEEAIDILPGVNCGGCGYPGCSGYAESVVTGKAPINLCSPGGIEVAEKLGELLGQKVEGIEELIAFVNCNGGRDVASENFLYDGVLDCRAAAIIGGGVKSCSYGCLGYGTCEEACPFNAISMREDRIPIVDPVKCTACGNCVEVCPRNIFELLPSETQIWLACSSQDKGKAVKSVCNVGCIGCGICAKVTLDNAVEMDGNLPKVNYKKNPNLIIAHYKCPTKSYVDRIKVRPRVNIDSKCKGSGKCVEACPVKGTIEGEEGVRHKVNTDKCIGCGLCVPVCPNRAISVMGAGLSYEQEF